MRFAEVFLRMGTALVAWMMLFTHFVWLAVAHVAGCDPDGDEMHRLLLGLAPFTCGFALLTGVTRKFPDIHAMLRWLFVPLLLLTPFCVRTIWGVFNTVNVAGQAVCADGQPPVWQQFWAPVQLVTVLTVILVAVHFWRSTSGKRANGQRD